MVLSVADLGELLIRPLAPPDPLVLEAIESGPIDPAAALSLPELDRLLGPAPLPAQTGWCTMADGVVYVAVQTAMPGVSAEMVDWWFDWYPRDPLRYRIWHPTEHLATSMEEPSRRGAKLHWGAVHHSVEDVGTGLVHARVAFVSPTELGFSTDALDDPAVGTVACAFVGDDRRRLRHSVVAHVFLTEPAGLTLRSHFWLGAAVRPYLPGALGDLGARALNRRWFRSLALPGGLGQSVARHWAEEFANLAALLPELHRRYG
jgi:phloretin hydrolase